jgi:4-amino-4-deoxy-L-arabinose transferase-like glycosyltransferase
MAADDSARPRYFVRQPLRGVAVTRSIRRHSSATRWLWLMVACLLAYWLMRLPNLLALPAHTDEGEYLLWAQWAWQGDPLHMLEQGKVLIIASTALLNPFTGGLFIARYLVLLSGIVGMAAIFAAGRKLHLPQTGLLAVLLWLGTPQLIFFERMSLHDLPLASMATLTLWLSLRMMESPRWGRAVWCGAALALCTAAKATGVIFLAIPVMMALFWRGKLSWRQKASQVARCLAIFALLLLIPALYIASAGADPFYMSANRPASLATVGGLEGLFERLRVNLTRMVQAERVYLSLPLLVALPLAAVVLILRNARVAMLLLGLTGVVFVAIALAASKLWLRYVVPATPFMLLLIAVGLTYWALGYRSRRPPPLRRRLLWGAALGWIGLVGLPYAVTAQRDPSLLTLPDTDTFEYVQWVAAGYGVREAVAYLETLADAPLTVMGSAANCYGGRAMVASPRLTLICPSGETWWDDLNVAHVGRIHEQAAAEGYTLILADATAPIIAADRLPQPLRIVREFPRPGGQFSVIVYCAGADPDGRCPPPATP